MSWESYYEKNKGRKVRELYLQALKYFDNQDPDSNNLTAVDLGSGAGIESCDLLRKGWQVIAIDKESASNEVIHSSSDPKTLAKFQFLHSSFEDLKVIPNCHFLYAYHSLPFTSSEHLHRLCTQINSTVLKKGIFAGSFFGPHHQWVKEGKTAAVSATQLQNYLEQFEIFLLKEENKKAQTAFHGEIDWHSFDIIGRRL